jgi:nicotinamidase-related amidase
MWALLVIDVQQGMFMLRSPPHQSDQVLARIAALLSRARSHQVPIFHVRHNGEAGHVLEPGTAGREIIPAVAPREREPIVDKWQSTAFEKTSLHEHLQRAQVDTVAIVGIQTEYCVDTACRAATALGYHVVLVADAHTTFDTSVLSAAQIIAHHNLTLSGGFARVTNAEEIRF